MESAFAALKDTPIPTILVIAGIVFLLLAIAGQLAGRIAVAPERQRWAAIIGGLLLVIGVVLHVLPQLKLTSRGTEEVAPLQSPGVSPSTRPPPEPSVQALTEEKEPNDEKTTATVITEGTMVRGLIATGQDQDFFRINPSGSKTRVILRTQSAGFISMVIVYDDLEKLLAMHAATVLEPATFSFESIPGSIYYIMVKPSWSGARGNYELVVRKE
jgi:hypothetical protein